MTEDDAADDAIRCTAIVRVMLEIPLTQPWDAKTPIGDVHRQATRDAIERVRKLDGYPHTIIGEPVVEIVTATRQKGR